MSVNFQPGSMTKIKRKGLSVETKLEIIKAVEAGGKKANIGRQYGIPSSTLSTILKNRQSLISKFASSHFSPSRKRFRTAVRADVDEALASWCRDRLANNLLVNGPILRQRAEQLAETMGYQGFRASSGWLTRFKERYQIGLTRRRKQLPCKPDLHDVDLPKSCISNSNPAGEATCIGEVTEQKSSIESTLSRPKAKPKQDHAQINRHKIKCLTKSDFSRLIPVSHSCLSEKIPDDGASAKRRLENRGSLPKTLTTENQQDEPVSILSRLLQELSRGQVNTPEQKSVAQVQDTEQLPALAAEKSRHSNDEGTEPSTSSEASPGLLTKDYIDMMHSLQSYLRQRNDTPEEVHSAMTSILDFLATCQGQDQHNGGLQMKITDFYFKVQEVDDNEHSVNKL